MKSLLRILYLEDDRNDVELVQEKLEGEVFTCNITHVETKSDFIAALEEGGFDIILADYSLPSFDGLSALSIARKRAPDIPFLFLSGTMGEELAIEMLKSGATDYVLKQRMVRLVPAIRRALKEAEERLERKKAEAVSRKLSRQNELILNSATEGIFGLDLKGNHTFVNSAAAQMLGYRIRELIGKPSHRTWHHSRADGSPYPKTECPIYTACLDGIIRRVKHEVFWRKDGTSLPVAYTSAPVLEGNKLIGSVVTFRDITKRKGEEEELSKHREHLAELVEQRTAELNVINAKLQDEISEHEQTEVALRQSEALLQKVLETLPVGVWILDRKGNIVQGNPESRQIWAGVKYVGIDRFGEYKGWWLQTGKLIGAEEWAAARAVLQGETTVNEEIEIECFDGTRKIILNSAVPIMNERSEIIGAVAVNKDITDRKQVEAVLIEKSDELLRSNNDLQQFAYIVSHDLQEPLQVIKGFLKVLKKRYTNKLDEKGNEFIELTIDCTKSMQGLIQGLLEYSRVGHKGKEFRPTECAVVLEKALFNLKAAIEESGAVVTCDGLPTIMADAVQLGSLLQNLIGNAIKFHGAEPPRVHVSAKKRDSEWLFSVRDNGIGIEPKFSERIFAVFQRLHTSAEYPGTGIGLAVCKKIVERHGGRIWVESEPGKGTTFSFNIPDKQGPL